MLASETCHSCMLLLTTFAAFISFRIVCFPDWPPINSLTFDRFEALAVCVCVVLRNRTNNNAWKGDQNKLVLLQVRNSWFDSWFSSWTEFDEIFFSFRLQAERPIRSFFRPFELCHRKQPSLVSFVSQSNRYITWTVNVDHELSR